MMDDSHGDGVTPLQLAQEGEQRGDLAADILIDTVQPDGRRDRARAVVA